MTLYYIVYYMVYRTEYRKELMPIKYALFMLLKERAFSTANAQCGEIYFYVKIKTPTAENVMLNKSLMVSKLYVRRIKDGGKMPNICANVA